MSERRAPYGTNYKPWIIGSFVLLLIAFAVWAIWQDHYEPDVAAGPSTVPGAIEDRPLFEDTSAVDTVRY